MEGQVTRIIEVNVSFAIPDGMWVKFDDGSVTWLHFKELDKLVGKKECDRLYRIAYHNGMTGMWYHAANGQNVYVDGVAVNAGA